MLRRRQLLREAGLALSGFFLTGQAVASGFRRRRCPVPAPCADDRIFRTGCEELCPQQLYGTVDDVYYYLCQCCPSGGYRNATDTISRNTPAGCDSPDCFTPAGPRGVRDCECAAEMHDGSARTNGSKITLYKASVACVFDGLRTGANGGTTLIPSSAVTNASSTPTTLQITLPNSKNRSTFIRLLDVQVTLANPPMGYDNVQTLLIGHELENPAAGAITTGWNARQFKHHKYFIYRDGDESNPERHYHVLIKRGSLGYRPGDA